MLNDSEKDTYLMHSGVRKAIAKGDIEYVRTALSEGLDVNLASARGTTILVWAVCNGHYNIVELLLKSGADLSRKDVDGIDVFWVAREYKREEILKMLESYEASLSAGS